MCAFEEETTLSERDAQLEAAAADVRLRALAKQVEKAAPGAMDGPSGAAPYGLARLACWTGGGCGSSPWQREPEDWAPEDLAAADGGAAVSALAAHLLEKYEAIPPLRASVLLDATSDPQRTNRVALRFLRAYAASGGGESSVRAALQAFAPSVTKKAAAAYCGSLEAAPLAALHGDAPEYAAGFSLLSAFSMLPLLRFASEEDVVARANASDYGLGASVWSADVERAESVSWPQLTRARSPLLRVSWD